MRGLNVVSVCRWLPTPDNPTAGVFVLRRLEAMARMASLDVLQPLPYFPGLRALPAWAAQEPRRAGAVSVSHAPMLYIPRVLKSLDGYWLYRSIRAHVRAAQARRPIDVLDAHFAYPDGVGAFLAAKHLDIPLFLTFRGLEADYADKPSIARQISAALAYATGCICVGHGLKDVALRFGADPDKLRVIHNAVDRNTFAPGNRAQARAELRIPQTAALVVSVGHLLAVKGHATLIEAFAAVRAAVPQAQLVIIGGAAHEADQPQTLAALVRSLKLEHCVQFLGRVPPAEIAKWLRAADAFGLASRREGCCNAVLEALATGTPVVATPVGDNPMFVADARNGFLAPVGDSTALAAGLVRALTKTDWDRHAISRELPVGSWHGVGGEVLSFFEERLRDRALAARIAPNT